VTTSVAVGTLARPCLNQAWLYEAARPPLRPARLIDVRVPMVEFGEPAVCE